MTIHKQLLKYINRMILKRLQRSIHRLSFVRHSFGVLLLDDKDYQADFDVLITDIHKDDLSGEISQKLGKKNLASLSSNEKEFQKIRKGIIYGRSRRGIISLPTRFSNKQPIWIHYLVVSSSPWTFLSRESLKSLIDSNNIEPSDIFKLKINGLDLNTRVSKAHFQDINLIGTDYLDEIKCVFDGKKKVVQIQFQ